jgi:hypothetical protein
MNYPEVCFLVKMLTLQRVCTRELLLSFGADMFVGGLGANVGRRKAWRLLG